MMVTVFFLGITIGILVGILGVLIAFALIIHTSAEKRWVPCEVELKQGARD